MKIKTHVKSGGMNFNRCETAAANLAVRTGVRAGGMFTNRCETLYSPR